MDRRKLPLMSGRPRWLQRGAVWAANYWADQYYLRNLKVAGSSVNTDTRTSKAYLSDGTTWQEFANNELARISGVGAYFGGGFTNSSPYTYGGTTQFPMAVNATVGISPIDGPDGRVDVFSDNFDRADTSPGSIGSGWTLLGPYVGGELPPTSNGYISGNSWTCNAAQIVYALHDAGRTIRRVGGTVKWRVGGGSTESAAALIITDAAPYIGTMLHVTLTRAQAKVQKRTAFGSFLDIASITFSSSLLLDTEYNIEVQVAGDQVVLKAAGQAVTATDADIPSVLGKFVLCECYHPSASMTDLVSWSDFHSGDTKSCGRITTTAANGYGQRNITVANDSATHTAFHGLVAKKVSSQITRMNAVFAGGTLVTRAGNIDLSTGATSSVSAGAAITVYDFNEQFWRVLFTATNNGLGNTTMAVTYTPSTTDIGAYVDVWGFQAILGTTIPMPFFLTDGAAGTRAADNVVTPTFTWFTDAGLGSGATELAAVTFTHVGDGVNRPLFEYYADASNYIRGYVSATDHVALKIVTGGATQTDTALTASISATSKAYGFGWSAAGGYVTNGTETVTFGAVTLPTVTAKKIGSSQTPNYLNDIIRSEQATTPLSQANAVAWALAA